MGQSLFQSLVKASSGQFLFESFESPTFVEDQLWTLLQGNPTTTTAFAFDGVRSFQMDDTFPRIEKTLPVAAMPDFCAVFYFYDTATNVTGENAFGYVVDTVAVEYGAGVNNAVSTLFYVLANGTVTAVGRTTGWHRVKIKTVAGVNVVSIDGVVVQSLAGTALQYFRMGSKAAAGVAPFLYFDAVQISTNYNLELYRVPVGYWVSLFTEAGVQIGTQIQSTALNTPVVYDISDIDSPAELYYRIVNTDRARQWFQPPTDTYFMGDKLGVLTVGFDRRAATIAPGTQTNRQTKEATSGVVESIFYYAKQSVAIAFPSLTEDQKNSFEAFFRNVQNEKRFSFALDEDAVFYAPLSGDASPLVSAALPVLASYVTALKAGSRLMVQSEQGDMAQVVTGQGVGASIVCTEPILYGFVTGDTVRALYYWPSVVLIDAAFVPMLENTRVKRWALNLAIREEKP